MRSRPGPLPALVLAASALLAGCRAAPIDAREPFADDAALRAELVERMQADQAVRAEGMRYFGPGETMPLDVLARWKAVDAENTAWIEQVLDARGWPERSAVGEEGATAAFLLVQHADEHPGLQRRALPLCAAAVAAGEADPSHLALLTDRVRLRDELPQLYGTQVRVVNGEAAPFEIENPERVDERRAAMGLEPLEDYLERIRRSLRE
jgi:hypothetical protein